MSSVPVMVKCKMDFLSCSFTFISFLTNNMVLLNTKYLPTFFFHVFSELQATLVQFVKDVSVKYPEDYATVRSNLPAESMTKLDSCLHMTNGTN